MSSRPNVIFILSDQHNAKVLSHKGHPDVKTPNLDRLAAEGVRCDNAITQNPICTPSRVSFLSGQYCHNHGIYGLGGPNPGGLPTVLGHFRRHGYATAAIGKIHCPEYWVEDDTDFFREVCPGCSVGDNPEYRAYLAARGLLEDWSFSEGRKGTFGQCLDGYMSPLAYRDAPEGWIVTQAMEFMRKARQDNKPFIAHVSFPRPHQTYAPVREFWEMYDENSLRLPPNWQYSLERKAPTLRRTVQSARDRAAEWTVTEPHTYEAGCRRKLRGYLGCVSMMDHAVGELLDWLDQHGLAENTVVVYSADHGDYACEHGIVEKAPGICSDAITRIPYIWRFPVAIKAGTVVEPIVETVDVLPTLCSLCELPPMQTADGHDVSPLLRGENILVREVGVTEFAWSKSLRKGSYRYVYYPREMFAEEYPDGFGELYNLADDPWEMNNLYFAPDQAARIRELERDLMDWLITTTRPVSVNASRQPAGEQTRTRLHRSVNSDGRIHPDNLRGLGNMNYL